MPRNHRTWPYAAAASATLAAAALLVIAGPAAAAPARTTPPSTAPVDAPLRAGLSAITAAGMPGAFAEARDGRSTARGASGVADVTTDRPVRPGFQHRVGSITKTFVATALLQLVGERRLVLDAPAARYLPELGLADAGAGDVTVRMLLNHTSGIGDYDSVLLQTEDDVERYRHTTFAPRELARIALAAPRTGAPGAQMSYSNSNYVLAGLILERLTGRPAAVEITRRIIRPLGLRQTYFPGTAERIAGPHARAYIPWPDGKLRDFTEYNMSMAWMAGELVSSPHDLNVFYRALLSGRLLRPAELAQMRTTVPVNAARPDDLRYGLGLMSVPLPCGRGWGHNGGTWGHDTYSIHSADGRRQVSLAVNMSFYYPRPHPIDRAINRLIATSICGPAEGSAGPAAARADDAVTIPLLDRPPASLARR